MRDVPKGQIEEVPVIRVRWSSFGSTKYRRGKLPAIVCHTRQGHCVEVVFDSLAEFSELANTMYGDARAERWKRGEK